jgi:PAS domain S-box-containing protein
MKPRDVGIGRLFESIRDAVVVAEVDTGQIVLWNPAATEIFGYSPTEALELRVDDLAPDRLKAQHRAGLDRYRETGHGPYVDSRVLLEGVMNCLVGSDSMRTWQQENHTQATFPTKSGPL